jgi:peroxiredoxin (alkyl hydroperoxide reductase subunit C)
MRLRENDSIPNSDFFIMEDGNPIKKNTLEFFKDKKVVLFGLPGAYTSVCSAKHLPGYVDNYEKYKTKGIDYVVCISVNDPFVMDAWGKSQNVVDKILMMADPFLAFTKAIGADVDKSTRGLGIRSNRYTMLIDNLRVIKIREEEDAGVCEISAAENFLNLI